MWNIYCALYCMKVTPNIPQITTENQKLEGKMFDGQTVGQILESIKLKVRFMDD